MAFNEWETVIGLEVHAQLSTESKLFSNESASFGAGDNENTSPVSLALPGSLPVTNEKAVDHAIKIGLALNCEINKHSIFARKNYFYPDLPKGYQISQFDEPICGKGHIDIFLNGEKRTIGITRAHLEEDAGKSTHHGDHTLINLNRAGVALLEIVSDPVITSPEEAAEYARTMRRILRYLDVCDGNLEEGSMRCDCNVSIRPKGQKELGTKVELKNINSFRFVEKALEYEIQRQIDTAEAGDEIFQETRLYDSAKNRTYSMRSKEDAHDYRYFPDPDLLPIIFSQEKVDKIKSELPELPVQKVERFKSTFNMSEGDARILTDEIELAAFFEEVSSESNNPKSSANWIKTDLLREMNQANVNILEVKIKAKSLAEMIQLIDKGTISGTMAKKVFLEMWSTGEGAGDIVKKLGLEQITDDAAIEKIVEDVLAANPAMVEEFRSGKEKVIGFLMGQVMKASKGQASPGLVNKILKEKLKG